MHTKIINRLINNLPNKPYCSNDLSHGLVIRKREVAQRMKYVQVNHPYYTKYLVLDLDYEASLIEILYSLVGVPMPNLLIENIENGRSHIIFELKTPIYNTDASRPKPILYGHAILKRLQQVFGADMAYVGLVTKNPISSHWRAYTLCSEPYTLASLNDFLELTWSDAQQPVKLEEAVGLGRNCYVFHTARQWAYVEVRQYRGKTYSQWLDHVIQHCLQLNTGLPQPMQYGEIKGIAKSISRFCWKNDGHCYNEFIQRQRFKSRKGASKGGKARSTQYDEIRKQAKTLYEHGMKKTAIAKTLGIHRSTIHKWVL